MNRHRTLYSFKHLDKKELFEFLDEVNKKYIMDKLKRNETVTNREYQALVYLSTYLSNEFGRMDSEDKNS